MQVRCYGACGRTIMFCDTKRDCNDLVASLGEAMRARALHGDIPQQQREVWIYMICLFKFSMQAPCSCCSVLVAVVPMVL